MSVMLTPEEALQRLEAGRKRLAALTNRASAVGGQIVAAKSQLAELRAEAETTYGSSDLDVLRRTFITRQEQDTAAIVQFEAELQAAETQIAGVEQALRVAGAA